MNIFLILLLSISTCFSVFMLVKSAKNAHELPDSASSFSYHYNNKIFTIWCVILAITCLHILPFKLWYLSALQFIGLLMVGFTPKYKTKNHTLHWIGGYLFGLASQGAVFFMNSKLLFVWLLFPIVFMYKDWKENATLIAEFICWSLLVICCILNLY